MVFIYLHTLFKDNSVIYSISNFNNSETTIICYYYNKPVRFSISNFDKLVTDMNIDYNTPHSCDCQNSNYLIFPCRACDYR